jgi:membrane protein DedA with SNARE-associated domain
MVILIHWTLTWLARLGVPTVFVVLFAESLGVPSPSEIVLLLSGLLVADGRFSLEAVVAAGALGSTLGASLAFTLARVRGRAFVMRRLSRVGGRLAAWERWEAGFARRAFWFVAVGRVISGVRMLISYPAGLFDMPWAQFLPATIMGSIAWPLLAASTGAVLGPRVMALLQTLHTTEEWVLVGILAVLAAWWAWRHYGPRPAPERKRPQPDPPL